VAASAEPLEPGGGKRVTRVADVMSREVELVSPDATVQEAATSMAEYDVGAVLIGAGESLEGILTDRDIILRAVVDGRNPAELHVGEIMSTTLFTCRDDDTLEEAFRIMSERQVRRLPVVDRDGHLVGIVTLSDLGRLERDPQRASATLREMAEPHRRKAVAEPEQASPQSDVERDHPEDTL
jgi:CBS domain-containing protein